MSLPFKYIYIYIKKRSKNAIVKKKKKKIMQDPKRFWVRNKRIYNLELRIEKFFISRGGGGDLILGQGPKA